jgi:hypothetical protein
LSFCVARSGIYHLFRALNLKPFDQVLVPDYHSGNEVAAMRAAEHPSSITRSAGIWSLTSMRCAGWPPERA